MATIINTLEVVVEPPRQGAGTGAATATPAQPPASQGALTPLDITDVAERRARYAARLAAH